MGLWSFLFKPRVNGVLLRARKLVRKKKANKAKLCGGQICRDWISEDGLSVSYICARGKMGETLEVKQILPNNQFEHYHISHIDPNGYLERGVLASNKPREYTDLTPPEKKTLISIASLIRKDAGITDNDSAFCREPSSQKEGVNEFAGNN